MTSGTENHQGPNTDRTILKNQVRAEMRGRALAFFASLTAQTKISLGEAIGRNLNNIIPKQAIAGTFNSLADEPNFNSYLDRSSMRLAYPRMEGESLRYYEPLNPGDFVTNEWGILEPCVERSVEVARQDLSVILVPGVAFDRELRRLGRGRGFYDRVLKDFRGLKVGVTMSSQVVSNDLPHEPHDIAMDMLVTENYVMRRYDA